MTEPCLFCGKPATRLCDAPIAMVDGGWHKPNGRPPYKVTTMEAMLSTSYTCDAPFCEDHGHVIGFICGDIGDTIDHCCGCFNSRREGPHGLMTPGAIDAIRKKWHSEYRRSHPWAVHAI